MPRHPLEQRIRERLAEWDRAGLTRSLRSPSGVDLSSNDYLNLSTHPLVVERFRAGAAREGCGSTGSRLLRGERQCFSEIERRFAAFKGTERALYFSSGYLANIGALSTLPDEGDLILSDELNHASLIDGIRLSRAGRAVFPHNDVGAVARLLDESAGAGVRFVVAESLFSMDGDVAPLADYAALCRRKNALLVVDEAHAVGIYGDRGSGLIEALGVEGDVTLSINTCGKALGVAGAFVAGPAWAIEYLVQHARSFVYTTAPPPAVADAVDASLAIVEQDAARRGRLKGLAGYLRTGLARAGIEAADGYSQIVTVIVGDSHRAVATAESIQRRGFDVRAIRPPTVPAGTSRLRISVNAGLTEPLIDGFVGALSAALQEVGHWSAASL